MANMSIYDPVSSRLNRLFNQLSLTNPGIFGDVDRIEFMNLKMDVVEEDKCYTAHMDLPGVKKEDVQIAVNGNQVSINAEIRSRKEEKAGKNVIHSERYEGRVYRSFTLDCDIDESRTQARLADGVLELTLPKKAETGYKQIRVE